MLRAILNFCSTCFLLATIVLVALNWRSLPESIPSHFNAAGEPDAWSSRGTLLVFPILSAFLFALFTLLERNPQRLNYPVKPPAAALPELHQRGRDLLAGLKATTGLLLLYLAFAVVQTARGSMSGIGPLFVPLLLLLLLAQVAVQVVRMSRVGRS